MRVIGVVCIAVGLVLVVSLRVAGRTGRSAAAWTTYNKSQALFAGAVAIIAGVLLLSGGVD